MATPTTLMPAPWQALTSRGVSPTPIVAARSSGGPATSPPRSIAAPGQLGAVAGVGAVAAEGEEAVEVAAGELDVGGGLDVAGDDAEQDALPRPAAAAVSSIPGITP